MIFFHESASENINCEMAAILARGDKLTRCLSSNETQTIPSDEIIQNIKPAATRRAVTITRSIP